MECDLETSVPDWIVEFPASSRLFNELGIDASCGGKSLEYVCRQRGLDPWLVLEQLRELTARDDSEFA